MMDYLVNLAPLLRKGISTWGEAWVVLALLVVGDFKTLHAQDVEGAFSFYSDENLSTSVFSTKGSSIANPWIKKDGFKTAANMGYSTKLTHYKENKKNNSVRFNSITLGLSQGLGVGTTMGISYGYSRSEEAISNWYAGQLGQWFLQDTLQVTGQLRWTETEREPLDTIDTDGTRLLIPSDLSGQNYSILLTHLTTPDTILRGSLSYTLRSDRPSAQGMSIEGRHFFSLTRSVFQLSYAYYENVGQIKPMTLYGEVWAHQAQTEIHQRLWSKWIATGGYRFYVESEQPRDVFEAQKNLGSDFLYSMMKWRLGEGRWLEDAPEIYILGGYYKNNLPTTGYLVGLGGKYLF